MSHTATHPWISFRFDTDRISAASWIALGEIKSKCLHLAGVPLKPDVAKEFGRLYLAKGAMSTTAIEGNTLTETEVKRRIDGQLELPPSKEYLGKEIDNIVKAFQLVDKHVFTKDKNLRVEILLEYNLVVLDGLATDADIIPGAIRGHSVVVGQYRAALPQHCPALLQRLCDWLSSFDAEPEQLLPMAVIKAVLSHVYLAWIHPFGDGNGRVARLAEYHILLAGGVPHPAAQLLSNFYNETRSEYYRQLDRASRSGGDLTAFLAYAVAGFRDALDTQIGVIKQQHLAMAWTDYVHEAFRSQNSAANTRRRHLVLDLSTQDAPVPIGKIKDLTPRLAEAYAHRGAKALTRDINLLVSLGLVEKTPAGIRARRERMLGFLPLSATSV